MKDRTPETGIPYVLLVVGLTLIGGSLWVGLSARGGEEQSVPTMEEANALAGDQKWGKAATAYLKITAAHPENSMAWFRLGHAYHGSGKLDLAIKADRKAAEFPEVRALSFYNLACAHAVRGEKALAFESLHQAFKAGYHDAESMASDTDLAALRDDPRFILPVGHQFRELALDDGRTLRYAVGLPHDFDKSKSYPVLIGFPPGDQSQSAVETGMAYWWGEQAAQRGWIVVSCVKPSFGWLGEHGERYFIQLLNTLDKEFNVEGGKYHIAGCSGGAMSSYHAALTLPERVHSLTGLPAHPGRKDYDRLERFEDVKVRLFAGENDEGWKKDSQRAFKRLKELGFDVEITIFPGEGHVMESLRADEFMKYMDKLRSGDPAKTRTAEKP